MPRPPTRRGRHGRGGQGGRQGGTREIPGFPGGQTRVQRDHPGAFPDFPTEHPGGTPRFSPGSPGIFHSVKLGLQSGAGGFPGYTWGVSGVSLGRPGVSPGCLRGVPGKTRGIRETPPCPGTVVGTWKPGVPGESPEEFRRAHVDFSEYIRECSGKVPGESWDIPGNAPGESWECPGRYLGMLREIPGNAPGESWECPGNAPGDTWECPGRYRENRKKNKKYPALTGGVLESSGWAGAGDKARVRRLARR